LEVIILKAAAKLCSLFFCLSLVALFCQSEASTPVEASSRIKKVASQEKWEPYALDEDGTGYFYNADTIQHLKGNRVKVWVRAIYSEKNPKYSQAEFQWEVDCAKKSMRGLAANAKKKDGTSENITETSGWSNIPADSTAETLHEIMCKKKEK
jgi:hypothetical protein